MVLRGCMCSSAVQPDEFHGKDMATVTPKDSRLRKKSYGIVRCHEHLGSPPPLHCDNPY
jgi:hypothetical protein